MSRFRLTHRSAQTQVQAPGLVDFFRKVSEQAHAALVDSSKVS
jgi:hypothetical protein